MTENKIQTKKLLNVTVECSSIQASPHKISQDLLFATPAVI